MAGYDKLERYMAALNSKELKRLRDYLLSPYFKIDPAIREFGEGYLKWHGSYSSKKRVSGRDIWDHIYKEVEFEDTAWRKFRSKFLDVIEQYLQQLGWETGATALRSANLLLRELDWRGLDQDFEQVLERTMLAASDEMVACEDDLAELVRFWEYSYNFYTTRLDPNKEKAVDAEYLEQRMKAFRRYAMFDTLKTIAGLENRRFIGREDLSIQIPSGFVDFLAEERQGRSPLIKCYILLLDALGDYKSPKTAPFLAYFFEVAPSLPPSEKSQLFNYAVNIQIRQYLWSSDNEVAKKLLEIYKLGMREHILLAHNGLIPVNHFKNICVIGCKFNEHDFVSNFIVSYRNQLSPTVESSNALIYCEALLLFGKKEFGACWKRLNEVASKKYLKVEIKSLGIKTQYELGDARVLESQLVSFERWLQRSRLPALRKEPQLKRIRVIRKIMGLKPGNKKEVEAIRCMILEEGVLDSDWLMEKLEAKK